MQQSVTPTRTSPRSASPLKVPLRGWIGVSLIGAGLMLVAGT
ncbi:hypothetical protein V1283_008473 [Bradyrhizobium sp. AZCC 2262]